MLLPVSLGLLACSSRWVCWVISCHWFERRCFVHRLSACFVGEFSRLPKTVWVLILPCRVVSSAPATAWWNPTGTFWFHFHFHLLVVHPFCPAGFLFCPTQARSKDLRVALITSGGAGTEKKSLDSCYLCGIGRADVFLVSWSWFRIPNQICWTWRPGETQMNLVQTVDTVWLIGTFGVPAARHHSAPGSEYSSFHR